jgi:hypothetical protein
MNTLTHLFFVEHIRKPRVIFTALEDGLLLSPSTNSESWYRLSSMSKFYRTNTAPKFSEEGDKWLDLSSGTLYTRVKQTNGVMFWVEF